jgi:hypothetical protein
MQTPATSAGGTPCTTSLSTLRARVLGRVSFYALHLVAATTGLRRGCQRLIATGYPAQQLTAVIHVRAMAILLWTAGVAALASCRARECSRSNDQGLQCRSTGALALTALR